MTKHFTSNSLAEPNNSKSPDRSIALAGLLIVASTYGLARYCFGLFLPEIRKEFSLSPETIGLIAGLSYAGYLAATVAGSWLSTQLGPRLPILLGGLAASSGMAMIGLAPDALVLAVGVFVAGMSPGLAYPPYSDVIVHQVEPSRQNKVYAWVNSGTGFGVAIAGPLALFASDSWRSSWVLFAALALVITLYNLAVTPSNNPEAKSKAKRSTEPLFGWRSFPLFLAACLFGIFSSVYWTFAVDLLVTLTSNQHGAIIFWIVLGVAGITGCVTGDLVNRWGFQLNYTLLCLMVGSAIAALPVMSQFSLGIFVSAAFFGVGFIVLTALFGMWSMRIFRKSPSIGFGATFFLISLGQGIGPVLAGFLLPVLGHTLLFLWAGLFCCCLVLVRPKA